MPRTLLPTGGELFDFLTQFPLFANATAHPMLSTRAPEAIFSVKHSPPPTVRVKSSIGTYGYLRPQTQTVA